MRKSVKALREVLVYALWAAAGVYLWLGLGGALRAMLATPQLLRSDARGRYYEVPCLYSTQCFDRMRAVCGNEPDPVVWFAGSGWVIVWCPAHPAEPML